MGFFEKTGKMAIGSRLRMLGETLAQDAAQLYRLHGVDFEPKWFPVFYVLETGDSHTITSIAREIRHSHPSVSKIVGEMGKAGLVTEKKDKTDGRRTFIVLSSKGRQASDKLQEQYRDVTSAIEELSSQAAHDLWEAIAEWEALLEQKTLLQRVQEQKKRRERANVRIVDYRPKYRRAFKALNEEWISTYFTIEETDRKSLDDPDGYILRRGGHILVALDAGEPVGVCALLRMENDDYDYELAKMAVAPAAKGKGIGWLLGQAAVARARKLGATRLYLESNTKLKPAISLYRKLGFERVTGRPTPYARCNIQMELSLV